jgi:transposase
MARRKKERAGLPRRYTFKLAPTLAQEEALLRDCRMLAQLWNGCLQRNEDSYRRVRMARHELWWKPYDPPRKARDGTLIEGRYVRRHLAHADREHSDADAPKLKIKTNLGLFDLTPEITQVRRELPEYAEQSKWCQLRVAKALEEAFNAFFRRARQGAGDESGYPKYRATARADWLPHMFLSGCKLTPSGAPHHDKDRAMRRWWLYLKGVPGLIATHGELPGTPLAWLDADIHHRNGQWWLSVCVELAPRRTPGERTVEVRLDLVDTFAHVNGLDGDGAAPPSFADIHTLQEKVDDLKSERDRRWPLKPGQKLSKRRRVKRERMGERIARLSARIARMRRERLHEWTTAVAAQAADLTVIVPPVKESTRSAKGSEQAPGAAVATVAMLNRHVLSQAPASAAAMLRYKAEEAGARVTSRDDPTPPAAIGSALSKATKAVRKARRALRKEERHGHHP